MRINKHDQFNLQMATSQEEVDRINSMFYGRFSYPWPPFSFEAFTEQEFSIRMINQDIGSWNHHRIPPQPKIWVAGCGTNQAVYTALKFPESNVLGTDISVRSLEVCQSSAEQLGIKNLRLEKKSINSITYKDEFDYIICTGVLHHNANPAVPLKRLSAALKPDGILELMLYNYYHTILMTAFQQAVRNYCGTGSNIDFEAELVTAKKMINKFPLENLMSQFLNSYKNSHDSELADALIQPVLHSYTIKSFEALIADCNLEFLLHCINQFDKSKNRLTWNMEFDDAEMTEYYEELPDSRRWQLGNLLMLEYSPMLWFYLQRKDSNYERKSEKEVCDEFLKIKFEKNTTSVKMFSRDSKGRYELNSTDISFPRPPIPVNEFPRRIYNAIKSNLTMKEVFQCLDLPLSFYNVNLARIFLTTSAFPYLKKIV